MVPGQEEGIRLEAPKGQGSRQTKAFKRMFRAGRDEDSSAEAEEGRQQEGLMFQLEKRKPNNYLTPCPASRVP